MATIFTRIIRGELPSHRVAEDEHHYAFLDINPVAPGHTLVVPKRETDYLFDLPEEDYVALMRFCRPVAAALARVVPCERVGISVVGLEVPHAHVHLVPLRSMADINFAKPALSYTPEQLAEMAARIREVF
ncbi:MAG: HIT family protein [Catalinimonas sp.]